MWCPWWRAHQHLFHLDLGHRTSEISCRQSIRQKECLARRQETTDAGQLQSVQQSQGVKGNASVGEFSPEQIHLLDQFYFSLKFLCHQIDKIDKRSAMVLLMAEILHQLRLVVYVCHIPLFTAGWKTSNGPVVGKGISEAWPLRNVRSLRQRNSQNTNDDVAWRPNTRSTDQWRSKAAPPFFFSKKWMEYLDS